MTIDFLAIWTIRQTKDEKNYKPAGIFSLLLLSFSQKKRVFIDKKTCIRRFFLSILIVFILFVANFILLGIHLPDDGSVLFYGLIFTPLFILPFYHFIYELLGVQPLSARNMLKEFRLRGVLALIMSANIIFISNDKSQHLFSLTGHFIFTIISLLGSFYLCSRLRKKATSYTAPFQQRDFLESATFRHLASILEIFYYSVLVHIIFIAGPIEMIFSIPPNSFVLGFSIAMTLMIVALLVKYNFSYDSTLSIQFYEEKILPLSFLFFGIVNIASYYF
jgi:hypothetical protein